MKNRAENTGSEEILAFLKSLPAFSGFDPETLGQVAAGITVKRYSEGSYVFRQGEPSKKTLFLVLEGEARALATVAEEDKVTTIRRRGDFFGVTVLLSDEPYPVSMFASIELTCLLISQDLFQKALASSDHFAAFFTRNLASRLKDLYVSFSGESRVENIFSGLTLRQKVSEASTRQVVTCLPMDTVKSIAHKMAGENVSSVVVLAVNGKPLGIITERDLVAKVLVSAEPDLQRRAHEIMSSGLITVRPDDFSYQALLLMIKHDITHLVVSDNSDVLHGIITVKDLVRTRSGGVLSVAGQIEERESFTGLASLIAEVDRVKQSLLNERAYASEICILVNELYDRITCRVIRIGEEMLAAEGLGRPPTGYCFISMGSAGRREQFSRTDQDNGIIYADPDPRDRGKTSSYFLALGEKIVQGLEECGFKRCSGLVMANNPRWCRPLSGWIDGLADWVDKLDPKDIRNMTIFLDYRYIYGEELLYENLKRFTGKLFRESHHALLFMAEDDLKHRVPLNIFRQIITKKAAGRRTLNLKGTVMVHMVDCIRLFALREGIPETSTFDRIHRLKERGVFRADDAAYLEAAYESLLMFRIRDVNDKARRGLPADYQLDLDLLGRKDKNLLKEALFMVNRLQTLTEHAFHVHQA